MPFERFTEWGKQFKAVATITSTGVISINQGAINRFGMSKWTRVYLLHDRDDKLIGIQQADSSEEEGSCRLRHRATGADISARTFLEYYSIPYGETERFEPTYDDDAKAVVIDLKQPLAKPRKRGTRGGDEASE